MVFKKVKSFYHATSSLPLTSGVSSLKAYLICVAPLVKHMKKLPVFFVLAFMLGSIATGLLVYMSAQGLMLFDKLLKKAFAAPVLPATGRSNPY
jgi:hypothetical protein